MLNYPSGSTVKLLPSLGFSVLFWGILFSSCAPDTWQQEKRPSCDMILEGVAVGAREAELLTLLSSQDLRFERRGPESELFQEVPDRRRGRADAVDTHHAYTIYGPYNSEQRGVVVCKDDPNLTLYVANDPVNLIDPTGECGAKHVNTELCLYAMPGAGGPNSGENRWFGAFVAEYGGVLEDRGTDHAVRLILDYRAVNPDARIVVSGYSRGGNDAVTIVNELGRRNVQVDGLILFDAHSLTGDGFTITSANVSSAINFYQQNPTTSITGFDPWGLNPYVGQPLTARQYFGPPGPVPDVINHNLTGNGAITHLNTIRPVLRNPALNVQVRTIIEGR